MRKIYRRAARMLGSVELYLDDIDEIVRIMKLVPDIDRVMFETESAEFDSVDELKREVGTELSTLDLIGSGERFPSWVRLDITPGYVYLPQLRDELSTLSYVDTLERFVAQRQRFWRRRRWFYPVAGILLFTGWVPWVLRSSYTSAVLNGVSVVLLVMGLLLLVYAVLAERLFGSRVHLVRRSELSSFWQRKKDDVFVLVIGAVLGVVGTLLVQAFA